MHSSRASDSCSAKNTVTPNFFMPTRLPHGVFPVACRPGRRMRRSDRHACIQAGRISSSADGRAGERRLPRRSATAIRTAVQVTAQGRCVR